MAESPSFFDAKPASRATPPNVVVVILDCVRAQSLARFGGRARTPALDRLASVGTVFTRAVAPGNWTIPSHMSIMTGMYPWAHGRRTFQRGQAPTGTIAQWLAARGYETALFTEESHLVAGYGLEAGYSKLESRRLGTRDEDRTATNRLLGHSEFLYSPDIRRLMERVPPLAVPLTALNYRGEVAYKREVCGEYLHDAFGQWLRTRDRSRPFHAFFNFVDGHEPYPFDGGRTRYLPVENGFVQVPRFYLLAVPGLRERVPWDLVEAEYVRSIESADRKVGRLLDLLEEANARSSTTVIVTSDHGQSFGEMGNVYHGCGASDSVLRVPLVVGPADGVPVPPRVDRWTSLCDVPSWIKSQVLGRPPYDDSGRPAVPFPAAPIPRDFTYGEGGPASDPNYSLRSIGLHASWNHRLLAAYRDETKWVLDLETGGIDRWAWGSDVDRRPPVTLEGPELKQARNGVFRIFGREDVDAYLGDVAQLRRPPLDDVRMKSWGYD